MLSNFCHVALCIEAIYTNLESLKALNLHGCFLAISYMHFDVLDWLHDQQMSEEFEVMDICDIAHILARLYASVRTQKGNMYSHSALVNLCAGINRHLQGTPFHQQFSIVEHAAFNRANQIFEGQS